MSNVYLQFPHEQIVATLNLLKYFHRFLASDCAEAQDPISGFDFCMNKTEAKRKLIWLIQVAINRKAGLPDSCGRKDDPDYRAGLRRDQRRLRDIDRRIRVYQFETAECRSRFSHLLSSYND